MVSWIFEDASAQHEAEQPEQEEVRQTWERTELVLDPRLGVLERLRGGELSRLRWRQGPPCLIEPVRPMVGLLRESRRLHGTRLELL
jgi:hypothetical protein